MNELLEKLLNGLKGTSGGTRVIVGLLCVALAAIAGLAAVVSNRPHFELAFSGLTDHELALVCKALSDANIPFQQSQPPGPFDLTPHLLAERHVLREGLKVPAQWLPALLAIPAGNSDSVTTEVELVGVAWAVLQPLIMMMIFTLIFGRFAKIEPPNGIPYPVFVFAGLIPWTLFSQGLAASALSLANQQQVLMDQFRV